MITVGAAMVKHQPELTREVLDDLVEMSRGVQHPLRGIFLRNFLLQSVRAILPDTQDDQESTTGTIADRHTSKIFENFSIISFYHHFRLFFCNYICDLGCIRLKPNFKKHMQTIYQLKELGLLITNLEKKIRNF